jgi:hypothetical protein
MMGTLRSYVIAAALAAVVTASNMSEGAYFSQSWGWVALAFLVPTSVLLILDRAVAPGWLRAAFVVLMLALAAWIALTAVWSISAAASVREVERMLVYVAVAAAVGLVLRRRDVPAVLAGVLAGVTIVCCYGLATRLFPDRVVVDVDPTLENRLAEPLGFPNAVGTIAAIGLLVALGFVAQCRRSLSAAAAGFVAPLPAATLYFTFSRGAWAAFLLAYAIMLAVDPRRYVTLWSSLVLALPIGACLVFASRQDALTTKDVSFGNLASVGHRFAAVLFLTTLATAVLAYSIHKTIRRRPPARTAIRATNVALVAGVALCVLGAVAALGGPSESLSHLRRSFDTHPAGNNIDLNSRLFNVYGTGRGEIWKVAWHDFRDAPVVGEGAGTFEYSWYENRQSSRIVRDAHSLYLEAGGELGLVGLALLASMLLLPLAGAIRARRSRFVPCGLAAYTAWAAASAVDWHWEIAGLTLTALLAGSVGLLAVERGPVAALRGVPRAVALGAAVALSVAAVWSLVGNQALFAGQEALARKDWADAADDGRRARALLFWSYEPDLVVGDAEAGLGDREGALTSYRSAVARDPENWAAWLRLAQVESGAERLHAYARVHALNPEERNLPGEAAGSG